MTTTDTAESATADSAPIRPALRRGVLAAVAVGIVVRFVADTPLWLDEALSVNIADQPIGQLDDALRRDGHPPLYYALLKAWMGVFGDGDGAVRALSGVLAVATLPLAYVAGRRLGGARTGWIALALFAASPFAIRFATETRMYALVSLLALALWLLIDHARSHPTPVVLAGIALTTTGLFWSHYWSFWLVGTLLAGVVLAARQNRPAFPREAALRVGAALVAGGVLFLPWVPILLDQLAHTGTPWGDPSRPAEVAVLTLFELGGGPRSEAQLLSFVLGLLLVLGVFGRPGDDKRVELDLRVPRPARALVLVVAGTMGLGLLVNIATGSTFQPRYAAVVVPFILLLAARGLSCLRGPGFAAVAAVVVVGGLMAGTYMSALDRSQGEIVADAISVARSPGPTVGDTVIYCPDQLGPSVHRYLGADVDREITYPSGDGPALIDWRDYADRIDTTDPVRFATVIEQADRTNTIWLVMATSYRTLEGVCEQIQATLAAARPNELVVRPDTNFYEPATLYRFAPR